jgi:hypothetical protein
MAVYPPLDTPRVRPHRGVPRVRPAHGLVRPNPTAPVGPNPVLAMGPSPWQRRLLIAGVTAVIGLIAVTALATSRPGSAAIAPSPTSSPAPSTQVARAQPLCNGPVPICPSGRDTESYRTVNSSNLTRECQHLVDIADAQGVLPSELENRIRSWSDRDTVIDLPVNLDPLDIAIRQTDTASCLP